MAEKTLDEIQHEIAAIQLQTARINLEKAKDENAKYEANNALRSRLNRQTQRQLRTDHYERARVIRDCTHRQGGSPGRERRGDGPSALRVVILPDTRTLIMCANCPLRVFSPLPTDKSPRQKPGETAAEAKARVVHYRTELEEFERLEMLSAQQLTPEAAAPMHCGKQFTFAGRDGESMVMPAPCDSYAQGRDNRQVAEV